MQELPDLMRSTTIGSSRERVVGQADLYEKYGNHIAVLPEYADHHLVTHRINGRNYNISRQACENASRELLSLARGLRLSAHEISGQPEGLNSSIAYANLLLNATVRYTQAFAALEQAKQYVD